MGRQKMELADLIKILKLKPLPVEGGLFVQTYRSEEMISATVMPERFPVGERTFGTAILYLYTPDPDSFSALHWLPTDEIYHFYLGDPVEMLLLYPDGHSRRMILGQDVLHGQQVQFVVPRGITQGSHLLPGGKYALIGTTMAPGFDETDYHGCERKMLISTYPDEEELIKRLTRSDSPLTML